MLAETRKADRRKSERFAVEESKVAYKKAGLFSFLNNNLVVDNPLVNMGRNGAQFLASEFIQPGANIVLQVDVPLLVGGMCFKGEVVWCAKVPNRRAFRVGVKFLKMDGATSQRLDALRKNVFFRAPKNRVAKTVKVN
jgi:hypothetical protein